MKELTFEQLPQAVSKILEKIDNIEVQADEYLKRKGEII